MHLAKRFVRQGCLAPAPNPAVSRRQPLRLPLPFLSISLDLAQPALRGASVAIQICNRPPLCNPLSRDLFFQQRTCLYNLGDLWNTVKYVVKCKNDYTLSLAFVEQFRMQDVNFAMSASNLATDDCSVESFLFVDAKHPQRKTCRHAWMLGHSWHLPCFCRDPGECPGRAGYFVGFSAHR